MLAGHKIETKNRSRKETLNNAYKRFRGREINIDTFKHVFFHCLKCRHYFKKKMKEDDKN